MVRLCSSCGGALVSWCGLPLGRFVSQRVAGGGKYLCGTLTPTLADLSSCEELLQVQPFFFNFRITLFSSSLLRVYCLTRFAADGHSKRLLEVSPRCRMAERHARAARIRRRTRNSAGESRSVRRRQHTFRPVQSLAFVYAANVLIHFYSGCLFAFSFLLWLYSRDFCSAWCKKMQSEWLQPAQNYNFNLHTHSRNLLSK